MAHVVSFRMFGTSRKAPQIAIATDGRYLVSQGGPNNRPTGLTEPVYNEPNVISEVSNDGFSYLPSRHAARSIGPSSTT
jgi:hypothetical protein